MTGPAHADSVVEPKPTPDLRRLVAQHAATARLMGVDFVPVYRRVGSAGVVASIGPADAAAPEPGAPGGPGDVASRATPAQSPAEGQRDRASAQARLDAIRARYEADSPHRAFSQHSGRIVFGEGDPAARLMFIGEAPGAEEDRTGRPFVGRAGQLLDRMIVAMGLRREDVYIANVLKTRPPDNATPTIEEAEACKPYLFDQIEAVAPEAIVTLGLPATRTVLGTSDSMGRLRGHWAPFTHPTTGFTRPVMPTFHPAFLLRQYTDENRAKVWSDLRQVMERLGLTPPKGTEPSRG